MGTITGIDGSLWPARTGGLSVLNLPPRAIEIARLGVLQAQKRPDLSRFGFRTPDMGPPEPFDLASVASAVCFITHGPVLKLRRVRRNGTHSYGWKHTAERWARDLGMAPYIANGDFIAACLGLDVAIAQVRDTPNAWIALSLAGYPNAFGHY
jgi:hypothetical protein